MSTNTYRKWFCEICGDWCRQTFARKRGWIEVKIRNAKSKYGPDANPWICPKCATHLAPVIATAHLEDDIMSSVELKSLRLSAKMTHKQFAEQLGVTTQTISLWERGLRPITKITDLAVRKCLEGK